MWPFASSVMVSLTSVPQTRAGASMISVTVLPAPEIEYVDSEPETKIGPSIVYVPPSTILICSVFRASSVIRSVLPLPLDRLKISSPSIRNSSAILVTPVRSMDSIFVKKCELA